MEDTVIETTELDAPTETEVVEDAPESEGAAAKSIRDIASEAWDQNEPSEQVPAKTAESKDPKDAKAAITAAPAPDDIKAPVSWKADARERWAEVPIELKREIMRRENEIVRGLNEHEVEQRVAKDFIKASAPYAAHYQAQGIDPIRAAGVLFAADHTFRTGSVAEKANLVVRLIDQYKIDLDSVNDVLNGRKPATASAAGAQIGPDDIQRIVAEQVQQQQRQTMQSAEATQINTAVTQFQNDPKNEFFNDVFPQMLGLLQVGQRSGDPMKDLQAAYDQACFANPTVRNVLAQRQQASKARVTAASASLPANGPRSGTAQSTKTYRSNREAAEAAWDQHMGGVRI